MPHWLKLTRRERTGEEQADVIDGCTCTQPSNIEKYIGATIHVCRWYDMI